MGGDYEDTIEVPENLKYEIVQGIRFHENKGHIHFHDDKHKLKCYVPKHVWWTGWEKLKLGGKVWQYIDVDNQSHLVIKSTNKNDEIRITMSLTEFNVTEKKDKVWHALNNFTNKLR